MAMKDHFSRTEYASFSPKGDYSQKTTVNGYIFRGSNCAIIYSASLLNGGQLLKE